MLRLGIRQCGANSCQAGSQNIPRWETSRRCPVGYLIYNLNNFLCPRPIRRIVDAELRVARASMKEKLGWLVRLEARPFTSNTHYFSSYREKFLVKYRNQRPVRPFSAPLFDRMRPYRLYHPSSHSNLALKI